MSYDLSLLAVDSCAYVAVEIVNVGGGEGSDGLLDSLFITRRHSLCKTCGGLYGKNIVFVPILATDHLRLFSPIADKRGTVLALHIESRECDEVIGSDLNVGGLSACEGDVESESVIDLGGGYADPEGQQNRTEIL